MKKYIACLSLMVAALAYSADGCGARCGGPNRQDPEPAGECDKEGQACGGQPAPSPAPTSPPVLSTPDPEPQPVASVTR